MALNYTRLTPDQQAAMVEQRLQQFEAEHYAHEMNKMALAAAPDGPEKDAALAQASAAQETIEAAISALQDQAPAPSE